MNSLLEFYNLSMSRLRAAFYLGSINVIDIDKLKAANLARWNAA